MKHISNKHKVFFPDSLRIRIVADVLQQLDDSVSDAGHCGVAVHHRSQLDGRVANARRSLTERIREIHHAAELLKAANGGPSVGRASCMYVHMRVRNIL